MLEIIKYTLTCVKARQQTTAERRNDFPFSIIRTATPYIKLKHTNIKPLLSEELLELTTS